MPVVRFSYGRKGRRSAARARRMPGAVRGRIRRSSRRRSRRRRRRY